ncbi:MAG: hypothetical protein KDC38_05580 [Planctomycetes bacterium]|nr:hypothetical protein [Planctomycetota bacterium]
MKVYCPQCEGTFRVQGHETGTTFSCPFCDTAFSYRGRNDLVVAGSSAERVRHETDYDDSRSEEGSAGTAHRSSKSAETVSPMPPPPVLPVTSPA